MPTANSDEKMRIKRIQDKNRRNQHRFRARQRVPHPARCAQAFAAYPPLIARCFAAAACSTLIARHLLRPCGQPPSPDVSHTALMSIMSIMSLLCKIGWPWPALLRAEHDMQARLEDAEEAAKELSQQVKELERHNAELAACNAQLEGKASGSSAPSKAEPAQPHSTPQVRSLR